MLIIIFRLMFLPMLYTPFLPVNGFCGAYLSRLKWLWNATSARFSALMKMFRKFVRLNIRTVAPSPALNKV